ncbi:MAG TPA: DNA-processing protein DprA [Steroidobacteraceae bacterium]|jgi:DNA processing protein|nr:DNA-processing protein DprA [Steroidobacteraceae bacterium]
MNGAAEVMRRRLALAARTPGLDADILQALSAASPQLECLEHADAPSLAALGLTTQAIAYLANPDGRRLDTDLRWLESPGNTLVGCCSPDYPDLLRHSPDAPAVLYVTGRLPVLREPQLAIVGSRNPTAGGRATARDFAARFARLGLCITSGMALGIDAASHEGALLADGLTVAVLGHGLDSVYPPEHAALAERIAAQGALVSEFPPGTPVQRHHFPRRNRIIAGLAHGTLVVEAAESSGSLITARLAGVAGREVFALPGSIHNPMVRGCHELIRQGAKLVERVEDVLAELKISLSSQLLASNAEFPVAGAPLDKEYKILLDALAFEPASVDNLIERTGMNSESIASMLLILELDGHVAPHPGGRYSRMAGR